MGLYADTINSVYDVLVAKQVGGQALDYLDDVFLGEQDASLNLKPLSVLVKLDDPFVEEEWAAIRNRREAALRILVIVIAEAGDQARPYGVSGQAAQRGVLTVAEDVMDALEDQRATILASNGKNIDMNLTAEGGINVGGTTWTATIVLRLKQRFAHGDR